MKRRTTYIKTKTPSTKNEKLYYRIFIGFAVAFVVNGFFEPKFLGHDWRYNVFIFWLPVIVGMLFVAIIFRKVIHEVFVEAKKFFARLLSMIALLVAAFIASYISFGLIADVTFKCIDRTIAKTHPQESITCQVTKFSGGKRPQIQFLYKGRNEQFRLSYKDIRQYLREKPEDYQVGLSIRKGVWDLYTVDEWWISKVE